jgi:rhodanese-related sulfurtransferase
MKRVLAAVVFLMFLGTNLAFAANMLKAEDFKKWLDSGKQVIIVDIQPAKEYEQHHFKGSIETNAFPAKTDEERARLDKAIEKAKASKDDVVIVCPRGRSGAQNTYDYMKSKGIEEKRLNILEGGVANWPYKDLFVKGR